MGGEDYIVEEEDEVLTHMQNVDAKTMIANVVYSCSDLRTSTAQIHLAPQAVSIMACLTLMTPRDVSLVSTTMPEDKFKHLKYYRSFRTSLYQVVSTLSECLMEAHKSMLLIKAALACLPQTFATLSSLMKQTNDPGYKIIQKQCLRRIMKASTTCKTESTKTADAFKSAMDLVNELITATTATAGIVEDQKSEVQNIRFKNEEDQRATREIREALENDLRRQNNVVAQAGVARQSAMKRPGFWSRLFGGSSVAKHLSTLESQNYDKEREREQKMHNDLENARRQMADIAARLKNLRSSEGQSEIDLKEIAKCLAEGLKTLSQLNATWSQLSVFFTSIEVSIESHLTGHVDEYLELSEEAEHVQSALLDTQMICKQIFICGVTLEASNVLDIYLAVSSKFISPFVSKISSNIIEGNEQQAAIAEAMKTMEIQAGEVTKFIEEQIGLKKTESAKRLQGLVNQHLAITEK